MSSYLFELLRNYLAHYGYWAVGAALLLENAGLPVPGETILLLASFLAYSEHKLALPYIILVGIFAATLGDNLGFAIGFYGGRPLLERSRRRTVCALRGGHHLCGSIHRRDADRRGAAGRRAAHELAEVSAIQFPGRSGLGKRHRRRGIFFWKTLGRVG
jgi:hypothetical protein